MKPRRVLVTLELETDASLTRLRSAGWWASMLQYVGQVHQAQVNVIRVTPPKKRAKGKRR